MVALLGLCLFVRWHNAPQYSGDEPHYLLVSESLVNDGDVDVKNDYLDGRYHAFYAGRIQPHINTSLFTRASPHWYSMHGVGLPVVLAPAYAADGAHGATVEMVVIAVVVLVLTFLWSRRFTGEVFLAAVATAALGFSPGFFGLEGRVFPDLTAAALLLGCLLLLELPDRRPRHLFLLGILVGASPWFHFKNALAFGTIAAIALVQVLRSPAGRERTRGLVLLVAPVAVLLIGYEASILDWYGSVLPTHMVNQDNKMFAISEARGLAAVSFDASRGLFTNNPALLLIFAGIPVWLRMFRGPVLRLALVIGPTILLQATFIDWGGAYSPAARYPLQYVPAAIPAIALLLREARAVGRLVAFAVLAFQWALATAFVWLHPVWSNGGKRSTFFTRLDHHHWPPLDHLMPSFDSYTALIHHGWRLAAWVLVVGLLVAYGTGLSWRLGRGLRAERAGAV